MARKRGSKPTNKARSRKQEIKDRYSHAREDAQLAGLIPTTPEEALGDERVNPSTQGEQIILGPVGQAVRENWATPGPKKGAIVDSMIEMVEDEDLYPGFRLQAAAILQRADKDQWERDNPELAGKTKGGGAKVDVNVNNQINLLEMRRVEVKPDPLEEAKRQAAVETSSKSLEPSNNETKG